MVDAAIGDVRDISTPHKKASSRRFFQRKSVPRPRKHWCFAEVELFSGGIGILGGQVSWNCRVQNLARVGSTAFIKSQIGQTYGGGRRA